MLLAGMMSISKKNQNNKTTLVKSNVASEIDFPKKRKNPYNLIKIFPFIPVTEYLVYIFKERA